jgi:ATP citrate (pro-S)-lyase
MSARAIREHDGKLILSKYVPSLAGAVKVARVALEPQSSLSGESEIVPVNLHGSRETPATTEMTQNEITQRLEQLFQLSESTHPWLSTSKLVVKPDQLIKRRGKGGLLLLNCNWSEAKEWIAERAGKEISVANGRLLDFANGF